MAEHIAMNPIRLIHPKGVTNVERFEMHFQGHRGVIIKRADESGKDCWQRVQGWLAGHRTYLDQQKSLLDPWAECTIYAGNFSEGVTDRLFHDHMRQQVVSGLRRVAEDIHVSDTTRAKAWSVIAQITGRVAVKQATKSHKK